MKFIKRFLIISLILGLSVFANGQQKSDKELGKFFGPVKTVEEEHSFVDYEDGKTTESERYFVRYTSFDQKGKKTKEKSVGICGNSLFEIKDSIKDARGNIIEENHYKYEGDNKVLWLKVIYTYDGEDKCIHQSHFNSKGELYREWESIYEYDNYGNWIKETALIKDKDFCKCDTYVPRQMYYRNIKYYK